MSRPNMSVEALHDRMLTFANRNAAFRRGDDDVIDITVSSRLSLHAISRKNGVRLLDEPTGIVVNNGFMAERVNHSEEFDGPVDFHGFTEVTMTDYTPTKQLAARLIPDAKNPIDELDRMTIEQRIDYNLRHHGGGIDLSVMTSTHYRDRAGAYVHTVDNDPDEDVTEPEYLERATYIGGVEISDLMQVVPATVRQRMTHEREVIKTAIPEEQLAFWYDTAYLEFTEHQIELDIHMIKRDVRIASACFESMRRALQVYAD